MVDRAIGWRASWTLVVLAGCTQDYNPFDVRPGSGGASGATGTATEAASSTAETASASSTSSGSTVAATTGPGGAGGVGGAGSSGKGGGATVGTGGASGTGGAGPKPTCDDQYAGVTGYVLCDEQPLTCTFNADTASRATCKEVCELQGGECEGAFDNGQACEIYAPSDCGTKWGTVMCVCSRGCGTGPACVGKTCVLGMCN